MAPSTNDPESALIFAPSVSRVQNCERDNHASRSAGCQPASLCGEPPSSQVSHRSIYRHPLFRFRNQPPRFTTNHLKQRCPRIAANFPPQSRQAMPKPFARLRILRSIQKSRPPRPPQFGQSLAHQFRRTSRLSRSMLIIFSQFLISQNPVRQRPAQFHPKRSRQFKTPLPLRQTRQRQTRRPPHRPRQVPGNRPRVKPPRPRSLPAPLQNSRHPIKLKRISPSRLRPSQQRKHPRSQSSQSHQVHLVVREHRHQRIRRPTRQVIKINLRNQFRNHVSLAPLAQNMPLKLSQSHRSQAQSPKMPRRMQQIQMSLRQMRRNRSSHPITSIQKRPIKRFSIKSNQHRPLHKPFLQSQKHRMLFAMIPHKKLLDLQTAAIPPSQPHKKRISPSPPRKPGSLRIQKKPIPQIPSQIRRPRRNQSQRLQRSFKRRRLLRPTPQNQMLAKLVGSSLSPKQASQSFPSTRQLSNTTARMSSAKRSPPPSHRPKPSQPPQKFFLKSHKFRSNVAHLFRGEVVRISLLTYRCCLTAFD